MKSKNLVLLGSMINLSAGGFAFSCRAKEFADAIGEKVELKINGFELLGEESLQGVVIRSSNNDGVCGVRYDLYNNMEE